LGNLVGRDHLVDLRVDGKILKQILNQKGVRFGLDSTTSGQCPVTGSCEHGNKPSGSVKGEVFLDRLRKC
jgi:hypothetical protein